MECVCVVANVACMGVWDGVFGICGGRVCVESVGGTMVMVWVGWIVVSVESH